MNDTHIASFSKTMKKTHKEFVAEIELLNPTVEVLGDYINAHSPVKCRCRVCGCIWSPIAQNIRHGQKCPSCANKNRNQDRRITQESFVRRVKLHNPEITILGDYVDAHTRVLVRCEHCKMEWRPFAWDIIRGTGCPNCAHTSTSFVEQFILLSLRKVLGDNQVISRDRTAIGKELDIYIPALNIAIEPGSWFWHKNKKEADKKKRELCDQKGIRLITIFDKYTEGEHPLNNNDVITLHEDLSVQEDIFVNLVPLVTRLFSVIKIDNSLTRQDWISIKHLAYIKSRRVTTDQFISVLKEANNKIEVVGDYIGYNRKIGVRCIACGYEWRTTPGHLMEGKACPKCAGILKKTNEEFTQELRMRNIKVTPLEPYLNNRTPIKFECQNCGHIWKTRPANILSGFGCPSCARKHMSDDRSLTHNEFLQRLSKVGDSDVIILSEYRGSKKEIKCKCKKCSYEWFTTPNSLLNGSGCIKCKGGVRKKVKCITTGVIYNSLSEAAKNNKLSVSTLSDCCNGKRETAGGKEWMFDDG